MLGADFQRGAWTSGLVLAQSLAEGGYGAGSDTIEGSLTGIYPWLRHALNDRLEAWGVAGYGTGTLTLTPGPGPEMRTDLDLWMAAAGLRGVVLAPGSGSGAGGGFLDGFSSEGQDGRDDCRHIDGRGGRDRAEGPAGSRRRAK